MCKELVSGYQCSNVHLSSSFYFEVTLITFQMKISLKPGRVVISGH